MDVEKENARERETAMKPVDSSGAQGEIRLSSQSWESGGMGFQEKHEAEVLTVREGKLVLRKMIAEGRALETQVQSLEYEYEISPSRLVELIKEYGTKHG